MSMKKVISFIFALVMVLAMVGCGKEDQAPVQKVYSISGECDEFRIINGIAVIGGEQETFYGGKLELKTDDFKNISGHIFKYYIDNGGENHTVMNMAMVNDKSTFDLKNQEIGQISAAVLNSNIDISKFEHNLFFELSVTDENGQDITFTIPMEVKQVTGTIDTEK